MTKGLKGVVVHSKELCKKVMHSRIPMHLPKPLLASWINPDSEVIHLTAMENTLCLREINIMFERTALEIYVVCIRRKKDCISHEWRERKQKPKIKIKNIATWSSKSAILLVYLMISIELKDLRYS